MGAKRSRVRGGVGCLIVALILGTALFGLAAPASAIDDNIICTSAPGPGQCKSPEGLAVFTPLLAEPFEGPVYLRSSNHNLPDLVAALHGRIDIEAVARLDSQHGGIRARIQFKIAGQLIECTTYTIHATVTGTSVTEIAGITPTMAGCTYAGNAATWTMNGCTYTLTGETKVNAKGETHGVAHVVCTGTNHITIDLPSVAANCELTIIEAGQTNGSLTATNGVKYTEDGSGSTTGVLIDLTATVPVVGDNCSQLSDSTVMTGTITVEGETETTNAHTAISVS